VSSKPGAGHDSLEGLSAQDRRVLDHIDRIRSTGHVILTKDRVNEGKKRGDGYFTRTGYIAVYDVSDFELDGSGGYRMRFVKRYDRNK
jgi:hypothetical protein